MSVFTLLGLFCLTSPATADWVSVTEQFSLQQYTPVPTGETTSVNVKITNVTNNLIEGDLRLLVIPSDNTPPPLNADGTMGEDGSNPLPYYTITSGQDGIFEPFEEFFVEMRFPTTDSDPVFTLAVEVNDASADREIFRKKISKTPEFYSGEGSIEIMPIYVDARNTKGQKYTRDALGKLVLYDETATQSEYARVKPIIVTYVQEEEGTSFNNVPDYGEEGKRYANEIYAAVSLDDGLTWKRTNLSRTATKSSFTLANGVAYPGHSESKDLTIVGPYALATWVDKYCRSGNPWDIAEEDDLYQVTGPQRSVDYMDVQGDEDPRPDLGERPFSCLWGARGVLDQDPKSPNYGTIVWYKAEQLTTGRRDAIRNFNAAINPITDETGQPIPGTGGFAVSWQEDPKGLKTGKGRGPGAGMSGACVNHKTDIWYSYIDWDRFEDIDESFVSNDGSSESTPTGDEDGNVEYLCTACPYVYDPAVGDPAGNIPPGTKFVDLPESWVCPHCGAAKESFEKDSKPHVLHRFSPPVRITDNAVCRERVPEDVYGHLHNPDSTVECDYTYEGGTTNQPLLWEELPDDWVCPQCGAPKESFVYGIIKQKHLSAPYCDWFADNPRVDRDGSYVDPADIAYHDASYCLDGNWVAAEDSTLLLGDKTTPVTYTDGAAFINGTKAVWTGEPLDGDTGASRANLSLVNWKDQTLAVVAYEETKGEGVGSDKVAKAPEQKAPIPVTVIRDSEDGNITYLGAFKNSDCVSCHYNHVVPRDRVVAKFSDDECSAIGGTWDPDIEGYWPYTPYPLEEGVSPETLGTLTQCVKFYGGMKICPKDSTDPECDYKALPTHLSGWHSATQDCIGCHLPYNTKDLDKDGVPDRSDLCPDTPEGAVVNADGCSLEQTPGEVVDVEKRERHGKNLYYHKFPFNLNQLFKDGSFAHDAEALKRLTIRHGYRLNQPNGLGKLENARRIRVVPNSDYSRSTQGITLGLLYKQGLGGQGAPADAFLQLFRDGFDPENIITREDGTPLAMNLSSSTPLAYKEDVDPLTGEVITYVDQSGHNTPKVERYQWSYTNLTDESGRSLIETDPATGEEVPVDTDGNGFPDIVYNPYENVFSTRLDIHGDTILTGFAYCANWAAAKKAKDHYDFYVRLSRDAGATWTLPVNASRLKNHEESVSDCRVMLTPPTMEEWGLTPDDNVPFQMAGTPAVGDLNDPTRFFAAIGTKENTPQPNPSVTELEEGEVFLDLFYSRGEISGQTGQTKTGEGDLNMAFETTPKENPKYVKDVQPYLDAEGNETSEAQTCDENGVCIANEENPAYPELIEVFDWVAKGNATQGDVQIQLNALGSKLYTIWEQELPIVDDEGQKHFQGADVWFRKIEYPDNDLNSDGVIDRDDVYLMRPYLNQPAGVFPEADIDGDGTITILDTRKLMLMCTCPQCLCE